MRGACALKTYMRAMGCEVNRASYKPASGHEYKKWPFPAPDPPDLASDPQNLENLKSAHPSQTYPKPTHLFEFSSIIEKFTRT